MPYLLIALVAILVYLLVMFLYQRRAMTLLNQDEFIEGYRKAQLIDIREKNAFDAGHILGARNIPVTQAKMRYTKELRKDQPVYLYCDNGALCGRAATFLKKNGYKDIFVLKGGFKGWTGKVKFK